MDIKLVVVRSFAGHPRGEAITDPEETARVLASEHTDCVVRVLTERKES
jgi:hypothetical protein